MKKTNSFFLALVAASVIGASTGAFAGSPGDEGFYRLADDYMQGYLAWRPLPAMGLGFHEYDGKLTDFSAASIQRESARLISFQKRLEAIDASTLSPEARFDYLNLRAGISRDAMSFGALGDYVRNPMTYAGALDVSPYIKRDFAPLEDRVRGVIGVLKQAPAVMAAGRANLQEALPAPWIEAAIEVGDGSADFLEKDLVAAISDLKNPALRGEFDAVDKVAVMEVRGFVKFLKDTKVPKQTPEFALGESNFAAMLRDGELITQSPAEILRIGLDELHREQALFEKAAALINPGEKATNVFEQIQTNHPTAAGLIPDTRIDLEFIRKFVTDHHIVTIPSKIRPRVEETLPFARAGSFASMDSPGPFEKKATEAYYYVTPVEAAWSPKEAEDWLRAFNYYTSDVVSIHEVYPGHYVQFLCMNASRASQMDKILGSYAFIEGWAHYSEQMMLDEGFGEAAAARGDQSAAIKGAKYRLAQLDEAMLRLCRLCVAIKMHCQGMSLADGTRFFMENCYYGAKPSYAEARRGTFDPGYANYTLGKLMILKLRKDYQAQEGSSYTLEKFHNEFLRHGMPPVPLLRQIMLKDSSQWPNAL